MLEVFKTLVDKEGHYVTFMEAGKYVEVTQGVKTSLAVMDRCVVPFVFASAMYHGLLIDGYSKFEY